MNLRHIRLIIKREYMERLRSPGFIIGTVIGVILIGALSFLPVLLNLLDKQTAQKIVVVDNRNILYPYIPKGTATVDPGLNGGISGDASSALSGAIVWLRSETNDMAALSRQVRDGKINAYITVSGETASTAEIAYHAMDRPSGTTSSRTLSLLTQALTQARIRESGLTAEQAASLFAPPNFQVEPIEGGTLRDEKVVFQSQALVYFLLVLLYGTMVMYGAQVAMGVVFEKSSRVMEVLITAVKPIELMLGKVLGIGLLGLTQYAVWLLGFVATLTIGNSLKQSSSGAGIDIASVPPTTLIFFLVFFVLGYLVYAAIYAALGSLVNRTEDVNSITTPLTLVLVATYLLSLASLGNPDAEYVRWLSYVPFLTPMLMFIRVALGNVAPWEPLLAVVILCAAVLFFAWLAAKIYRVGVLLYGKRPSFREIGRLLRAA